MTTPSCWFRSFPTHKGLTRYVNYHLNIGKVPEMHEDGLSFRLGEKDFFAHKFPSAFGCQVHRGDGHIWGGFAMVDRKTAFRLYDLMGEKND